MKCKCGVELPEGSIFCTACGEKVNSSVQSNVSVNNEDVTYKFCNQCGEKNESTSLKCVKCGNVFEDRTSNSNTKMPTLEKLDVGSKIKNIEIHEKVSSIKVPTFSLKGGLMKISIIALVVVFVITSIVKNSLGKKIDYVFYNTINEMEKDIKNSIKSNNDINDLLGILEGDFSYEDEYTSLRGYSRNTEVKVNRGKNYIEIGVDDRYDIAYNILLEYNQKKDELLVSFGVLDDDFVSVEMIIKEPSIKIKNKKLVLSDEYENINNEFIDDFTELMLDSVVDVKKSKEKGFDNEFEMETNVRDLSKISTRYIYDVVKILKSDINGSDFDFSTDSSYYEIGKSLVIKQIDNIAEDIIDEFFNEYSIPNLELNYIVKTENNKIKAIEKGAFEVAFDNTKNYLNNTISLGSEDVEYDFTSKEWYFEHNGDTYFEYDLKEKKGKLYDEVEFEIDGDKNQIELTIPYRDIIIKKNK